MTDIPEDVMKAAADVVVSLGIGGSANPNPDGFTIRDAIAHAILAERERWKPASVYFDRYCQDEAEDVENCVCGIQQHEDAKAFAAVATPLLR